MRTFRNSAYASCLNADKSSPYHRTFDVRSVGLCGADCNFQEKARHINFGEFFWCSKGSGIFYLGGKCHTLNPGEVFFYPPGSVMNFSPSEEGMLFFWVTFFGSLFMPLCSSLNIHEGKRFCGAPPEELFMELISAVRRFTPDRRIDILNLAMPILMKIAVGASREEPVAHRTTAQNARDMIEREFISPLFNVDYLARLLGVHRVTLCREFKKEFHITPSDFITGCRLRRAAELLERHQYSVKEISQMCGFSTPEYFATVFSSRFGCPPSQFIHSTGKK